MKKFAIAVTAVAAFTGSAIAADMPVKAPLAPVVRAVSWTGCYAGAGGGYGMWNQDVSENVNGRPETINHTNGGRGWFGTVQGGCDYQFAGPYGNWVIGAFGDVDISDMKGDATFAYDFGPTFGVGNEKLRWSWALGGRVGYVVLPKLLTYISGGYTQARFGAVNLNTLFSGTSTGISIPEANYHGWFIGSGYEYSLDTFFPGLFWKTEYRFADYGSKSIGEIVTSTGAPNCPDGCFFTDSHKYVQTIRSELVYRFNWR